MRFLGNLRTKLALSPSAAVAATALATNAEELADAPVSGLLRFEPAVLVSTMSAEEQYRVILNYAIINSALARRGCTCSHKIQRPY